MIKIEPSTIFKENAVYYFDHYTGSERMNILINIIQRVLDCDKSIIIYDFENLPFEEELKDKISEVYQKRITLHKLKGIYSTSKKILELLFEKESSIENSPVIIIPSIGLFRHYYSAVNTFYTPTNSPDFMEAVNNRIIVLRLLEELSDKYTFILGHQLPEGMKPEIEAGGIKIPKILL